MSNLLGGAIDVIGHLLGELFNDALNYFVEKGENKAREMAIEGSSIVMGEALGKLPQRLVGDDLRDAIVAMVDGAASVGGLSIDEKKLLYDGVFMELEKVEEEKLKKETNQTVMEFKKLNKNEAIK